MITYFSKTTGPYSLEDELDQYIATFPEDRPELVRLREQLARGEALFDRTNYTGHMCGAGIVLSPDRTKILLVHHILYDRWQQPGGHAEATDVTPLSAAWREITEETAVKIKEVLKVRGEPIPIHIGVHYVPANPKKKEAEHYHYDFRYVFVAESETIRLQPNEVHEVAWVPLDDPRTSHIAVAVERLKSHILAHNS
jgi:8-oxo-dGTP pyrophosphatase MutT (NUDIX family)